MNEALRVENLHQIFNQNRFSNRQPVHALSGVDLVLEQGQTLGIVGETGCGKSTLCRSIMGLYKPVHGRVLIHGEDPARLKGRPLKALRRRIQMVFQDPADSMNPRMTVASIVAEPLVIHSRQPESAHRKAVARMLGDVGLDPGVMDRYPHEFSGGQRQRIAIARALILQPEVLVCDEPVSALDVSVQAQILNLLLDLQVRHHLSLVFVSHALGLVRHMSDRIAVMYLGMVVEQGPALELCTQPGHPYTQALLAAYPDLDTAAPEGKSPGVNVPGADPESQRADNLEPPSPVKLPKGCLYQGACPLVHGRCKAERPAPRPVGEGHLVACHLARTG